MDKVERSMFFSISRMGTRFKWEEEWERMIQREKEKSNESNETDESQTARIAQTLAQPVVDYASKDKYHNLGLLFKEPPEQGYPQLTTFGAIMDNWDQQDDFEGKIMETLMHFNFSNPEELEMARKFRDANLPFKLTHVPQLVAASRKWTDEYILEQYDNRKTKGLVKFPVVESSNQFLPRYLTKRWNLEWLGLPPTRQNDWTYRKWSQHAQYADAVRLSYEQPHFHVQPFSPEADSSLAQDLPSETFMHSNTSNHEGLVCRFSERGTVTSVHYDASGRDNMVGEIAGAKRYILSPPTECSKLGTEGASPESVNPRHSYLNFGNLKYLDDVKSEQNNEKKPMSKEERTWLQRASQAKAVETVLKTGEVLYIPPFWYHYIISLQKTTQCNVRSGNGPTGSSLHMSRESNGEQNC